MFQEYTKNGNKRKALYKLIGFWFSEAMKWLKENHQELIISSFSENGLMKEEKSVLHNKLVKILNFKGEVGDDDDVESQYSQTQESEGDSDSDLEEEGSQAQSV